MAAPDLANCKGENVLTPILNVAPVDLHSFTAHRRQPIRDISLRGADFDEKFDDDTLFFDAFQSGENGGLVLVGPPFFNLAPLLEDLKVFAFPSGGECPRRVATLDRAVRIYVAAPEGTSRLKLTSALGSFEIEAQPSGAAFFAGRRVLLTLSKDNRLEWIQDWIRYHRDVHGADAALIYDNGSTAYDLNALAEAVDNVAGLKSAMIVSWPFKYGPIGLGAGGGAWDSDFCQSGALEHARWRFLAKAASVMNGDIDELVVGPDRSGVFAAAESSLGGVISYHGYWRYGVRGGGYEAPPQINARHRDFPVRMRPETRWKIFKSYGDRCKRKWVVVPSRCPERSQWKVHKISKWIFANPPSLRTSFRHFHSINTNWMYKRDRSEDYDPRRHEIDADLQRSFDRVNWDA